MKNIQLFIAVLLIGWMLGAMADTQAYGKRATAKIKNDTEYTNGEWCIDARSF